MSDLRWPEASLRGVMPLVRRLMIKSASSPCATSAGSYKKSSDSAGCGAGGYRRGASLLLGLPDTRSLIQRNTSFAEQSTVSA